MRNLKKFVEEKAIADMTPAQINEVFNQLKALKDEAVAQLELMKKQQAEQKPAFTLTTGDKLYPMPPSEKALFEALADAEERQRMEMVAISVTAQLNTRQSAKEHRLPVGNQYRTTALKDVEAAVDREIALREQLLALKVAAKNLVREKLDDTACHPCDEHDDVAKSKLLSPTWQNLFELTRE